MSIGQFASANVHDFLTRIVPGGIASLSIGALSMNLAEMITNLNPFGLLILISIFYVAGEIIEFGRVKITSYPVSFGRVLYTSSGDHTFLSPSDKFIYHLFLRPKMRLLSIFDKEADVSRVKYFSIFEDSGDDLFINLLFQFNLREESIDSTRLYKLLVSFMDPALSSHARRLQRTYIFFENVKIASGLVIIYAINFALADYPERFQGLITPSIIILVMGLILVYEMAIFNSIEEEYVDTLLIEYYQEMNSR